MPLSNSNLKLENKGPMVSNKIDNLLASCVTYDTFSIQDETNTVHTQDCLDTI